MESNEELEVVKGLPQSLLLQLVYIPASMSQPPANCDPLQSMAMKSVNEDHVCRSEAGVEPAIQRFGLFSMSSRYNWWCTVKVDNSSPKIH